MGKEKFTWGRVIEDYHVGPYTVRAFHPRKTVGARVTHEIDTEQVNYHGYIDGVDCNESWYTIDEALAGMIVRKSLGPNHRAIASHFISGLNKMAEE